MRHIVRLMSVMLALTSCTGCGAQAAAETPEPVAAAPVVTAEPLTAQAAETPTAKAEAVNVNPDMFTDRDYETDYSDCVTVTLSDSGSSADGAGVSVDGSVITITQDGTYRFTGTLTNGQIVAELPDDAKTQFVLDNASVTCEGGAALYVKTGDKLFVTTAAGSENALTSTGEYAPADDNVDGTIFSRIDLTLNGLGTLAVSSETGHGIVAKDDLKVTSGRCVIVAAKDGVDANDSIRIGGGTIDIRSEGDGMQADTDDPEKGYLYIADGVITIECGHDGMQASSTVTVEGGSIDILAGGGKASAPEKTNYWNARDFGSFETENAWEESQDDTAESDSAKGIKAELGITVSGGTIALDTADDGIHANGDVAVSGGTVSIVTGDDGIHADNALTISAGTLDIDAHEGLEALNITLEGGEISIVAGDDGLNASGSNPTLLISGGVLHVKSGGDTLDSNGTLLITGGEVYITGPQGTGDGMIDYDFSGTVSGGLVIGTGVAGMQSNFGQNSTQGSILYTLGSSQPAGSAVTLTDANGNVIAEYTAAEDFQVVLISAPEIAAGETYTLTAGAETAQIEMTSLLYGAGGGFGGKGGGSRGMRGM